MRGTLARIMVVGVVAAGVAAPTASADGGSPNYLSKLVAVSPAVNGLTLRVVDGDDALTLSNRTGRNVLVTGYENEAYLRFLVGGRVEVNVNSPAKYLNEERYGRVSVPETASPKAKPRWELVASNGTYTWHEHRIHWMSTARPPGVKDPDVVTKVYDWNVPIRVGATRVLARGTLWWIPTGRRDEAPALVAAAEKKAVPPKQVKSPSAKPPTTTAAEAATPTPPEQEAAAAPAPAGATDDSPPSLVLIGALALAVVMGAISAYIIVRRRRGEPGRPRSAGEAW